MSDPNVRAPLVSLPTATLAALHEVLEPDLAREVGFQSGEGFLAALEARLGHAAGETGGVAAEEFWERLSDFFVGAGWGALESERLHPAILSLSSASWAEAEGRASGHPACHLTTGILADVLSRVAGSDLAVMEVECRASGASVCRFLIGNVEALDRVYRALQTGQPFREAVAALD